MSVIPEGYRVAVLSPEGTVLDTVDLGGFDLSKTFACIDLANEVEDAIKRDRKAAEGAG